MRIALFNVCATFLVVVLLVAGCSRSNDFSSESATTALTLKLQQWLHQNGGIYKQEKILVKTGTGQQVTGQLDWRRLFEFSYQGKSFVRIPFVFGKNGAALPGNNEVAPAWFDLIIRINGDNKYSGAIRTTIYGAKLNDKNGPRGRKVMQSYRSLSGKQGAIWESDMDFSHPKRMYLKSLAGSTISTNTTNSIATQSLFCDTYWYTTYETICWYETAQDKIDLNATCTAVANQNIVVECFDAGGGVGGGGDGWSGGGGGGGGTGGNSGGEEGDNPPGNQVPQPEPNNPGDKLCKSTFHFKGGTQSSYWITNVSGLKFESIGGINILPSTHVTLTNGITSQAMNGVPTNDYFGLGRTSLQYLQDLFPQLFTSGDIYSAQQGGQTVWLFTHTAAQTIANWTLNFVAAEIVLIMNSAASIPNNQAAWTTLWTHSNSLIKNLMPGSQIGQGYVPTGGNSNAIYSPNCP